MKRIIVVFLFLGMMIPMSLRAQVIVANLTGDLVEINGTSIRFRSSKEVNLPINNGAVTFSVVYYEGLVKKGPVKITKKVDRNRLVIKDFNSESAPSDEVASLEKDLVNVPIQSSNATTYSNSTDWWAYVEVKPQNRLKNQSIFVPSEPFKGLALRPGETSGRFAKLRTGPIVFPVFISSDSTNTNERFAWALVNKIITEGQSTFDFLPEDIMRANSGEIVKKAIISKLQSPFIISDGKSKGTVIVPNSAQRLELYIGWNIVPIQYKDQNGFPTEAILILLVDGKSRAIMAREQNKSDITVVPSNVVVTSLGR